MRIVKEKVVTSKAGINRRLVLLSFVVALLSVWSSVNGGAYFPLATQGNGRTQSDQGATPGQNQASRRKVAPDLAETMEAADVQGGSAEHRSVILQISEEKLRSMESSGAQLDGVKSKAEWSAKIAGYGGTVRRRHGNLGLLTVELPLAKIRELENDPSVAYLSPDRPIATSADGHIETTTGATAIRALVSGTTLEGTGIGIAILDTGIDSAHKLTRVSGGHPGVVVSVNFLSSGDPLKDREGHGSHVASLAAGSKELKSGSYRGIAPGAKIINLRVLDDNGRGTTSSVIAALNWCVANRNTNGYNIRVINLSLGTPARDSYRTDPLCLAVRRATDAGLVVVASAGNYGKDEFGRKLYGGINSPGIEPAAITVGAANTFGTNTRNDDRVTSYSSRGPTRGYTVVNNQRVYDNLLKPDLVAPGNKIIAALSRNPDEDDNLNNLVLAYPELAATLSNKLEDRTMYLSGTSMSAPIVSGAAALMLQANPTLTPNLVKAILMYSAQPIAGANTLEQGAGLLNIDGAVRLARLVKTNPANLTHGADLLNSALPNPQTSTIAGQLYFWGQGIITNHCFIYGSELMTRWQSVYGLNKTLSDATIYANGNVIPIAGLLTSGVNLSNGAVLNFGVTLSDGFPFLNGVTLSDGTILVNGNQLWDGIVADNTLTNQTNGMLSIPGDSTTAMPPIP